MAPARTPQEVVEGVVDKLYPSVEELGRAQAGLRILGTAPIGQEPTTFAAANRLREASNLKCEDMDTSLLMLRSALERLFQSYRLGSTGRESPSQLRRMGLYPRPELSEGLSPPHPLDDFYDGNPDAVKRVLRDILKVISHEPMFKIDETIARCRSELDGIPRQKRRPAIASAIYQLGLVMPRVYRDTTLGSLTGMRGIVTQTLNLTGLHNDPDFLRYGWPHALRNGPRLPGSTDMPTNPPVQLKPIGGARPPAIPGRGRARKRRLPSSPR